MWSSPILSCDGYKYCAIFLDHFTRYIWFYPLTKNLMFYLCFNVSSPLLKIVLSDPLSLSIATTMESIKLSKIFLLPKAFHVTLHHSLHAPEHNGFYVRHRSHILETGLTLLHQAFIPTTYWAFAFAVVAYLVNRQPKSILFHAFLFCDSLSNVI